MVAMFNSATDIKQPTANSIAFIIIQVQNIFSNRVFIFYPFVSQF